MGSVDYETEIIDPMLLRARGRVGVVLREKWRLDVLLGLGGMAAVFAATHRNGSRAAVKLLHAELSINPQAKTRFLREGYVANAVGHAGAVKVIDDDVAEDGSLFLVTELLDGETLEERRVRFGGQLDEDEVLSVADQLLDVLVAAHAKGIVHRDIKPENVFLTRDGQVKVLDFGIARLRELSTASTATRAGSTMGTPAFMPNEQARGLWDEVDARTDLWAVGATMYTLLTGHLVHEGRTTNEVLLGAMTKPAPQLRSVLVNVPVAVARVVDRALAYEKGGRWSDAATMQEAVRRAYHDRHGAPITTAPRLTVPETVPNRTLSSSPGVVGAKFPTTGQPVAASKSGPIVGRVPHVSRAFVAAIAAGSALTVGALILLAVVITRNQSHGAAFTAAAGTESSTAFAPRASVPPSVAPSPSAPAPPEVAASDLPSASATPPPGPRMPPPTKPSQPAVPPAAPASAKPNCNPPYTLDPATGKKHYRVECL